MTKLGIKKHLELPDSLDLPHILEENNRTRESPNTWQSQLPETKWSRGVLFVFATPWWSTESFDDTKAWV